MDLALGQPTAGGEDGEILVFRGPLSSRSVYTQDVKIYSTQGQSGIGVSLGPLSTPGGDTLLAVGADAAPAWVFDVSVNTTMGTPDALWWGSAIPTGFATGDVDGDGYSDLLLGFPSSMGGDGMIKVYSGSGFTP